jgi:hypothetical protein
MRAGPSKHTYIHTYIYIYIYNTYNDQGAETAALSPIYVRAHTYTYIYTPAIIRDTSLWCQNILEPYGYTYVSMYLCMYVYNTQ